jgi:uncharacterized protein involved in exopolysaccharide biosynthesis
MSDQTTSGLMDQIHQLKRQLATARAARDAVARDYQAASRGEEAARQQLAEAEKRGAVKALARVSEEIDEDKRYPGFDLVIWLTGLQNGIESGEVTA